MEFLPSIFQLGIEVENYYCYVQPEDPPVVYLLKSEQKEYSIHFVFDVQSKIILNSKNQFSMRKAALQLGLVVIGVTSVHAVKLLHSSSLHARIYPAGAVENVWAIQGSDSLKMNGSEGDYSLIIHPGHWKIWVETKKPFRNMSSRLDIKPGINKDLGDIKLQN